MPKYEIFHQAGNPVSDEIKTIVEKYFDVKEIEKLERMGGRILISLAAPYKQKIKKDISIDDNFLEKINSVRDDSDKLKENLDELSIKQLKKLCKMINHPIRSNANSEEIKRELIRSIQAMDFWNSIARE